MGRRIERRTSGRAAGRWSAIEVAAGAIGLAWIAGQLARDTTLATALLFYLPSLVVAAALLLLAGVAVVARRRARSVLLLALAPLAVGLLVEHRWLPRPGASRAAGEPLRVLHWNVSGGWAGLDEIAHEIATHAPDLVVLSEAPERVARRVGAELPALEVRTMGALTVLAERVEEPLWIERSRELQAISTNVSWRGRRLQVIAANLASSPWVPRQPSLLRMRAAILERSPDLVVGDLNAPRRSRVLACLPPGFRHAYDQAGRGWSASWPVPVPLLSLDHLIVGRALRARSYRLRATPWSDHRLQLAELDFVVAAE